MRGIVRLFVVLATLVLSGCGSGDASDGASSTTSTAGNEQRFPDVVDVSVEMESANVFAFSVTISSPYDTPERYAGGWRIIGPDETVYGEHTLAHDHANEQPFTRTQTGVEIPSAVSEVTVGARDSEHGYGGETQTVVLERQPATAHAL